MTWDDVPLFREFVESVPARWLADRNEWIMRYWAFKQCLRTPIEYPLIRGPAAVAMLDAKGIEWTEESEKWFVTWQVRTATRFADPELVCGVFEGWVVVPHGKGIITAEEVEKYYGTSEEAVAARREAGFPRRYALMLWAEAKDGQRLFAHWPILGEKPKRLGARQGDMEFSAMAPKGRMQGWFDNSPKARR